MSELGDGPIQPEFYKRMNVVAVALDELFNGGAKGKDRKVGFVLMVYNFNDDGGVAGKAGSRCNYISNGADRRDVVVLMKEMIARFEGQPELTGKA